MKKMTTWALKRPVVVGADQRPDQDHRGAGGADEAREDRADREQAGIDQRRAMDVAGDQDAAGDREERKQQDDEGNIFEQHRVQRPPSWSARGPQETRADDGERGPEGGELAVMMFPEMREEQRPGGDREQQAGEGQRPQERHAFARQFAGGGSEGRRNAGAKKDECGADRAVS